MAIEIKNLRHSYNVDLKTIGASTFRELTLTEKVTIPSTVLQLEQMHFVKIDLLIFIMVLLLEMVHLHLIERRMVVLIMQP